MGRGPTTPPSCLLSRAAKKPNKGTSSNFCSNKAVLFSYKKEAQQYLSSSPQKFLGFIGSDLSVPPLSTTTPHTTRTAPVKDDSEPAETYRDEGYEEVLRQYFKKGFRMDSPLEIRKFKRYYTATHDRETN